MAQDRITNDVELTISTGEARALEEIISGNWKEFQDICKAQEISADELLDYIIFESGGQ